MHQLLRIRVPVKMAERLRQEVVSQALARKKKPDEFIGVSDIVREALEFYFLVGGTRDLLTDRIQDGNTVTLPAYGAMVLGQRGQ